MGLTAMLLAACVLNPVTGLDSFLGRDLTKLSKKEQVRFDEVCAKFLPKEERHSNGYWLSPIEPTPRWIKPYRIGGVAWLYLRVYPGYDIPDISYIEAFAFDEKWNFKASYKALTGYRLFIKDVKLANDDWLPQPVLTVKVTSAGPFFEENGKATKPVFHPESGIVQRYTFDENGAHLIGIAAGNGEILSNSYEWHTPSIGPNTVGRSQEAWAADLQSSNISRQLGCLVWLAGLHRDSRLPRESNVSRETVADAQTYETVKSNSEIKERVRVLSNSSNPWLKKQAAYTLKCLNAAAER